MNEGPIWGCKLGDGSSLSCLCAGKKLLDPCYYTLSVLVPDRRKLPDDPEKRELIPQVPPRMEEHV